MIHPRSIDDRARHAPEKPQRPDSFPRSARISGRRRARKDRRRAKQYFILFDFFFFALYNKKIKSYDNKELGRNGIAKLSSYLPPSHSLPPLFLLLSHVCNSFILSFSPFFSTLFYPFHRNARSRQKTIFRPTCSRKYAIYMEDTFLITRIYR